MTFNSSTQQSEDTTLETPGLRLPRKAALCGTCAVRRIAICRSLKDEELEQLNAISTTIRVDAGEEIIFEGGEARHAFNVISGVVRLSKMLADGRRQITGFLYPGDFLNLARRDVYECTAEAVTKGELCRMPLDGLARIYRTYPDLEHCIHEMTVDELAQAREQLLLLGRKTAREKVASFLVSLIARLEQAGLETTTVHLPMTRADIADYLGLTIETVSRTLTALGKEGAITLAHAHDITVKDPDLLSDLSGGA